MHYQDPQGQDGRLLLELARSAIAAALNPASQPLALPEMPWLHQPGATFVTLTLEGRIRGSHGTLEPMQPLARDLIRNAEAAAFRQPGHPPLNRDELAATVIEVSLLSAPEPLPSASETGLLSLLRPGVDGLVFAYGRHRSLFLPHAWEQHPDAGNFLQHLKYRAGLPPDFWHPDVSVSRFAATSWREPADR